MQRADVTLRINGKVDFTVEKTAISAAEAVVLKHIHGDDAVVNIRPRGNDKTPHSAEREKLVKEYGEDVVKTLFPGFAAALPADFRKAGIAIAGDALLRGKAAEDAGEGEPQPDGAVSADGFVGLEDDPATQAAA